MLQAGRTSLPDGILAHPVTQPHILPVSPLVAGFVAFAVVLVVALVWPRARRPPRQRPEPVASWQGTLPTGVIVARLVAVVLLVVSISAGRLGVDDELQNIAPALVIGMAWPLLPLASALLGPVWRWVDPWDGIGRTLITERLDAVQNPVWPAVVAALVWVWYLSAYTDPLDPRSVGTILAGYTVLTVAGCLAVGRARWLAMAEPFGIVLTWMALLPRGRLREWHPPRGAEVLLGVLAGGVLFGLIRRSEIWGELNMADGAAGYAALGLVGSCATVAGLLWWMGIRERRRGADATMAQAAVPALVGIIVAVAMNDNRLFTSVQLLPGLLGDPFGLGWDLLGRAGAELNPSPLGTTGLLAAQLFVLIAGHLAGAVVSARDTRWQTREPAIVGLSILAGVSVVALVTH